MVRLFVQIDSGMAAFQLHLKKSEHAKEKELGRFVTYVTLLMSGHEAKEIRTMSTVLVLGGAGGIGQVATQALVTSDTFAGIRVADLRLEAARAVVDELEDDRLQACGRGRR